MRRASRIPALAPKCLCSPVTLPCVVGPALNVDSTTPMNRSFVGRVFSMGLLLVLLLLTQAAVIPSASAQSLYVGNGSSNQTVNITSGVNNYIETLISVTPTDSNNLLSISNPSTYLSVTLDLYVGFAGSGSMTISSGARVQNRSCNIGNNTGSMGSVTVSGGLWTNFSSLYVGKSGSGSMTVSGGRVISNSDASIGAGNSSTGSVMVSDGSWSNGGNLFVGNQGSGSMTISGGVVEASNGWIGLNPGSSNSSVVMSGGNWVNSGILVVGNDSSGSMTISGGTATNTDGYIGNGR